MFSDEVSYSIFSISSQYWKTALFCPVKMRADIRSGVLKLLESESFNLDGENASEICNVDILTSDVFEELDQLGWQKVFLVSEDLSKVELSFCMKDIMNLNSCSSENQFDSTDEINLSFTATPSGYHAICLDLPITFNSITDKSLNQVLESLASFVLPFAPIWKLLEDIDSSFIVLEPQNTQLKHFYRKIAMKYSIVVTLAFDPAEPQSSPIISLNGPRDKTASLKEALNRNWGSWSFDLNVLTNLCSMLEVSEHMFSRSAAILERSFEQSGFELFDDIDNEEDDNSNDDASCLIEPCKICLSVKVVCSGNLEEVGYTTGNFNMSIDSLSPSVFCSLQTCSGRFHVSCLKEWFRSRSDVRPVFGSICGPCPTCKAATINVES